MNVRISQDLLSEVRAQINSMRLSDCKLNLGQSDLDNLLVISTDSKQLSDIVWGEHVHFRDQMPKDWLRDLSKEYHPHIWLRIAFDKPVELQLRIKGKTAFYIPPRTMSGSKFTIGPDKVTGELSTLVDIYKQYQELSDKWQQIGNDVITYLKSAKSLNSALKNWPDLRAFIPGDYLDRIAAKPERTAERKKAEEALASIDRNLAVTSATLVKLAAL
jgi:hypothetical protein